MKTIISKEDNDMLNKMKYKIMGLILILIGIISVIGLKGLTFMIFMALLGIPLLVMKQEVIEEEEL